MVISCPECSTRFRVDESKIPEQGAKIRCARCKHVFAVQPPAPEPEPINEEPPAIAPPPPEVEGTTEEQGADDSDFGFDDFEAPEVGAGVNDEFDPAVFDSPDDSSDDDFSFGDDYGNVTLSSDEESENTDEAFSFGAESETESPQAPAQNSFGFSPSAPPQQDPVADSFSEMDGIDEMSMPPREEPADAFPPASPSPSKTKNRSLLSVVILFILILILAILIAAGVLVWKNGPGGLEQLIANLTGQPVATEVQGKIRLANLTGSFINNRVEGELFAIRGVAINDRRVAQAAIQVKGIIFDKSGKQLLQKTIFCGSPISDNDLRKLPYSKMEEMMGNQFGESLANLNVTPGQSIPFTIVFRNLPKTLSEFVVEVADSKPAAQ